MGKILDINTKPTSYYSASQTPPNLRTDNYYLQSLQDKVNTDWEFRPNRVLIEQQNEKGEYSPIEVVIQTVKTDTGTKVSDDIRRLVFRDIHYPVRLGTKFRFSYDFDINLPPEKKNIWLATNKNSASFTSEVVISRCNTSLGSVYTTADGHSYYHYEPAVCTTKLQLTSLYYNEAIVTPQSQVILIVQFNEYTKQYKINQRFILGYGQVYRVKAINNFNSLTTSNPYDVDTIMLYVEQDEASEKDNFETRIAYNEANVTVKPVPEVTIKDYVFRIISPSPIPSELYSTPLIFECGLYQGDELIDVAVQVELSLNGVASIGDYCEYKQISDTSFSLARKRMYNRAKLKVHCFISAEGNPSGELLSQDFELSLRGLE